MVEGQLLSHPMVLSLQIPSLTAAAQNSAIESSASPFCVYICSSLRKSNDPKSPYSELYCHIFSR